MLVGLAEGGLDPLVVSHAATGDYKPLEHAGSGDLALALGSWPRSGVTSPGPGSARRGHGAPRSTATRPHRSRPCGTSADSVLKRAEPRALWPLPALSPVPVIAFTGGADPQKPGKNLSDLKQHLPDGRIVVFPHLGHDFNIGGCLGQIITDFVDRGTTTGLDTTRCSGQPSFPRSR